MPTSSFVFHSSRPSKYAQIKFEGAWNEKGWKIPIECFIRENFKEITKKVSILLVYFPLLIPYIFFSGVFHFTVGYVLKIPKCISPCWNNLLGSLYTISISKWIEQNKVFEFMQIHRYLCYHLHFLSAHWLLQTEPHVLFCNIITSKLEILD